MAPTRITGAISNGARGQRAFWVLGALRSAVCSRTAKSNLIIPPGGRECKQLLACTPRPPAAGTPRPASFWIMPQRARVFARDGLDSSRDHARHLPARRASTEVTLFRNFGHEREHLDRGRRRKRVRQDGRDRGPRRKGRPRPSLGPRLVLAPLRGAARGQPSARAHDDRGDPQARRLPAPGASRGSSWPMALGPRRERLRSACGVGRRAAGSTSCRRRRPPGRDDLLGRPSLGKAPRRCRTTGHPNTARRAWTYS